MEHQNHCYCSLKYGPSHSSFLKNTKSFVRGYSQSLHHQNLNLTYWNDNNAVCFLDNDVDSAKENWSTIEVNGQAIHTPPSVVLYRQIYGMVDRTNQHQAYYNSECRSVRKQSRVLDSLIETYALCNTFTIWKNLNNITEKQRLYSSSEFRFAVIRNWYAKCRMHNNKDKLLRNPSSNVSIQGQHSEAKLTKDDAPNKEQRLRCRICGAKTRTKCDKCSQPNEPLALCSFNQRNCWNEYYKQREFDVASSQSQDDV